MDLNWSPDDSSLASASLDNTVHIWNMATGICTSVLRGHSSLVKGVTWDPIGSFIASQSDDKTVIIWRTSDWSLAHKTEGHWTKSLGSTFFRRLGWSPCGHFITTTHGFQKPRHSAPVLERGEWAATFDFLGHNAPIIVVKFNHYMFRRSSSNSQDLKASSGGWANGASKTGGKESLPYNVIAIGSQDRTITVWTTASPRPLFVAKHFFSQSVVDLSWSPDGYSLFACSLDGSVATFSFDAKELGHKLTDEELDALKKSRYGDVKGRQTNLVENPAQLLLEAAAAKRLKSKKMASDIQLNQTSSKSLDVENPTSKGRFESQVEGGKKTENVGAVGANKIVNPPRLPNPVKQKEYRRPDGRKRIIPEAVGVPAHQENLSVPDQHQMLGLSGVSAEFHKDSNGVEPAGGVRDTSVKKTQGGASDVNDRSGITARAGISDSLVIEKVSSGRDGNLLLEHPGTSGSSAASSTTILIRVLDKKEGADAIPMCLEARPRDQSPNDIVGMASTSLAKETEIVCTRGLQTLWSDRISGKVTVLAGNTNLWAVGCDDGCLQIYTKYGRRAIPVMMMGSGAVFIDCDESWKLLLVTNKGTLYVWDLFHRSCLLHDSLASLITSSNSSGTIKVMSAKLSKSGSPLVVLATRHAFLFDMNLKCWLRVADDCFPASNFASSFNLGSTQSGELAALQVDVRKFLARKPGWSRVADDGVQTRTHLEAQLASALALKSPNEYRQCLLSYVRFLAREADESRLREVCEGFLGPPTGMAEAVSSDPKNTVWDPSVLGMKKHKLLKEDILPAMASNRKVQRLLSEFMDLLSEYEIVDQMDHTAPATTVPLEAQTGPVPLVANEKESALPPTNQTGSEPSSTDHMDTDPPAGDQLGPTVRAADQLTSNPLQEDPDSSISAVNKETKSAKTSTDQAKLLASSKDHINVDVP